MGWLAGGQFAEWIAFKAASKIACGQQGKVKSTPKFTEKGKTCFRERCKQQKQQNLSNKGPSEAKLTSEFVQNFIEMVLRHDFEGKFWSIQLASLLKVKLLTFFPPKFAAKSFFVSTAFPPAQISKPNLIFRSPYAAPSGVKHTRRKSQSPHTNNVMIKTIS